MVETTWLITASGLGACEHLTSLALECCPMGALEATLMAPARRSHSSTTANEACLCPRAIVQGRETSSCWWVSRPVDSHWEGGCRCHCLVSTLRLLPVHFWTGQCLYTLIMLALWFMKSFHTHYLIWKQLSEVDEVDVFTLQRQKLRVQKGSFISSLNKYLLDVAVPAHEVGTCLGMYAYLKPTFCLLPCAMFFPSPHMNGININRNNMSEWARITQFCKF